MEKERQHSESLLDQQRLDVLQQQELNRKLQSEKQEYELNEKRVTEAVELNKKKLESQTIEQEIENKSNEMLRLKEETNNNINLLKINEEKERRKERHLQTKYRQSKVMSWLKILVWILLFIFLWLVICLGLFRFYRWSVETPLIKEVEKIVEVERIIEKEVEVEVEKIVEKKVEVEKIIEKEVIPEECTQIRRNGKVYVSCDGINIKGVPTISDSGLSEIPELITD